MQKSCQVRSPHDLRRLLDLQKESRIWTLHFEMILRDLCSSKSHQCARTTSSKFCLLHQYDSFSSLDRRSPFLHNKEIQRHFVYGRTFGTKRGLRHERKNFVLLNLSRQHSRYWMKLSSTELLAGPSTAYMEPKGKLGIPVRSFATSPEISSPLQATSSLTFFTSCPSL